MKQASGLTDSQAMVHEERAETTAIYRPLDASKRQIRLLRLNIEKDDDSFHGEPQVFSLEDATPFKALSYCWTQAMASRIVWINDNAFYVRPNLYAYLEIMRTERDRDWIFIDAICINQQDIIERSQQVELMRGVYQGAKPVVACLGGDMPNPSSEADLEEFQRMCDGAREDMSPEKDSVQQIFRDFVSPEYWTRLWIVQEIALARDLVFRRARLRVHTESLFLYLIFALRRVDGTERADLCDLLAGLEDCEERALFLSCVLSRQKHNEWAAVLQPRVWSLFEVMGAYSGQMCSITRDRIYGLLALTDSVCQVDYSAPLKTVYLQILVEDLLKTPVADTSAEPSTGEVIGSIFRHTLPYHAVLRILDLSFTSPAVFLCTVYAIMQCNTINPDQGYLILFCICSRRSRSWPWPWRTLRNAQITMDVEFKLLLGLTHQWLKVTGGRVRLPACDESGPRTPLQWHETVCEIIRDVRARLQRREQVSGTSLKQGP